MQLSSAGRATGRIAFYRYPPEEASLTGCKVHGMSQRPAQLREAYDALGYGDLDPWIRLLDPRVVWRATDRPDVPETPN